MLEQNFDNPEKQRLLLSYLISSPDLFAKVQPILNASYFDPRLKGAAGFLNSYYEEYKAVPTPEQIMVETGQSIDLKGSITKAEQTYAENEFETFCKNKAMESAIMASPALIAEGKFGDVEKLIKDAISVGLQRNLGLDYFDDPEARLKRLQNSNMMTPTDFIRMDELLGGGLNRKEMTIFAAPSGVGKSITMSNIARNLVKRKLNGVYITLELAEEVVSKRFDSMFTGIGQLDILKDITKTSIEVKSHEGSSGRLFIKRMPEGTTTAAHIRAYLKEFEMLHGFIPDFLVVDYLDIMGSVQKVSVENQFIKDKHVAEELRAIANDYNLIMITASQLGRSAQQVENADQLNQGNIAGGISKINTTDNLVAIIQTDQMRAKREYMFKMLKTRSSGGVGSFFYMDFDPVSLLMKNRDDEGGSSGKIATGLAALQAKSKAKSLLSMTNKAEPKEQERPPAPIPKAKAIRSDELPPWMDASETVVQDDTPGVTPSAAALDIDNLPFQ
jgi:RecA/RadA recombinase